MIAFELSKWYLDCVTDSGDAGIAYVGMVHWGPVRVHYSSLLDSTAQGIKTRQSLRPYTVPAIRGDSLGWRSRALNVAGEWQRHSAELHETIFAADAGSIEWRCVMPRAIARINDHSGLGYAECLNMTIPPWRLPIRTLRWGRFLSVSDWIVWIDWQGEFTCHIVYWNGREVAHALVEDSLIEFGGGTRLIMDRSLVLRQGPLGVTALAGIPGLRDTFPGRLLRINECKWRSRARLERPGSQSVDAWAIHERVDWPK